MPYRDSTPPARRAKITELDLALQARGYRLHTYQPLKVTRQGWTASVSPTTGPRLGGRQSLFDLTRPDYAQLLHTVTDDLAWARFAHRLNGQRQREEATNLLLQRRDQLQGYGRALARAQGLRLDGDDAAADAAHGQSFQLLAQATETHAAHAAAEAATAVYDATIPQTPDDARDYLARLQASYDERERAALAYALDRPVNAL